jgi:hypothetical protein
LTSPAAPLPQLLASLPVLPTFSGWLPQVVEGAEGLVVVAVGRREVVVPAQAGGGVLAADIGRADVGVAGPDAVAELQPPGPAVDAVGIVSAIAALATRIVVGPDVCKAGEFAAVVVRCPRWFAQLRTETLAELHVVAQVQFLRSESGGLQRPVNRQGTALVLLHVDLET